MRPGALCVMASGQHLMQQWPADSLVSYQLVCVGASFVSVCKTNILIADYSSELYMIIIPQELRHSTMPIVDCMCTYMRKLFHHINVKDLPNLSIILLGHSIERVCLSG